MTTGNFLPSLLLPQGDHQAAAGRRDARHLFRPKRAAHHARNCGVPRGSRCVPGRRCGAQRSASAPARAAQASISCLIYGGWCSAVMAKAPHTDQSSRSVGHTVWPHCEVALPAVWGGLRAEKRRGHARPQQRILLARLAALCPRDERHTRGTTCGAKVWEALPAAAHVSPKP